MSVYAGVSRLCDGVVGRGGMDGSRWRPMERTLRGPCCEPLPTCALLIRERQKDRNTETETETEREGGGGGVGGGRERESCKGERERAGVI